MEQSRAEQLNRLWNETGYEELGIGFGKPLPSDKTFGLLGQMACVELWVRNGDPRAEPYLQAGVVKIEKDGMVMFMAEEFAAFAARKFD